MPTGKAAKRSSAKVQVELEHLADTWIGFAAAIDWIAFRGRKMPRKLCNALIDEAATALIEALCELSPSLAEPVVEGISRPNAEECHVAVPLGIWPSVAALEVEFGDKPYLLVQLDERSEWGGQIMTKEGCGYTDLRIRSSFVKDLVNRLLLPSHPKGMFNLKRRSKFSEYSIRLYLNEIHSRIPEEFRPPTRAELIAFGEGAFPEASRDILRKIAQELVPDSKTGPRGPRNGPRKQWLNELREKLKSAQLQN